MGDTKILKYTRNTLILTMIVLAVLGNTIYS